jgi:glycerol-3-phosphate dehydrogenase
VTTRVDVAVVGGGVVGAAVARRLARTPCSVALLEGGDIGAGTSKANTAILHTGFDTTPGTAEAELVRRGYELLARYAPSAGIALEATGALLVAWSDEQADALPAIAEAAAAVGYDRCELVDASECYRREPALGPGAVRGLVVPDEQIICPWTPPLAYATESIANGGAVHRRAPLDAAERRGDSWRLRAGELELDAGWVVNAAGLRADEVEELLGHPPRFTVTPRRGQLVVFDKLARELVREIILPVPSARTKGVLVTPTVYGNVMVGPTAEDLDDKDDTACTAEGLAALLVEAHRLVPALTSEDVTATYAGVRAATEERDYRLLVNTDDASICLAGIRSTGLTASLALAEWVAGRLRDHGIDVAERDDAVGVRLPDLGEASVRPYQDAERIAADGAYGAIVCHCERVTAGELRDACQGPLPAFDLDGLRRRTRAMTGRCQGFWCSAELVSRLRDATGTSGATTGLGPAGAAHR